MAQIEGFRIRNFRALKDVAMGRIGTDEELKEKIPLTPMTAVIGHNGAGKSSIFDAFGFLADCMNTDIETACNLRDRGGFDKLISNGCKASDEISFSIYYREWQNERPITYEFSIGKDKSGLPIVVSERLRQRDKKQKMGRPLSFLMLEKGIGYVWIGKDSVEGDDIAKKDISLSPNRLAITTLAEHLKDNPRITQFRDFIQRWYLSYFTPDLARKISPAGGQNHLNLHGDNMGNVVQFLERNHPILFARILREISKKIPGIGQIDIHRDEVTNNLYLLFRDKGFAKPFTQQQMSDGTLKMFCYLLLLNDPDPAPFICIEEPENGLYHKLLETLATEFREHATAKKGGAQVFVTTHQPYFVDALKPEEVWILTKGLDGFSSIRRCSDDPQIVAYYESGLQLGDLWYSEYFGE